MAQCRAQSRSRRCEFTGTSHAAIGLSIEQRERAIVSALSSIISDEKVASSKGYTLKTDNETISNNIINLLAILRVPHCAFAGEKVKPVRFYGLPAAVAKPIKKAAGDATPACEAAWDSNGQWHEIAAGTDGRVSDVEEIITLAEACEVRCAAITKEAENCEIIDVEKVLEKNKAFFEARLGERAGERLKAEKRLASECGIGGSGGPEGAVKPTSSFGHFGGSPY